MILRIIKTTCVIGALAVTVSAFAQTTGTRIDRSRFEESPVAGWDYGRCVANFRTAAAEALLAAEPSSSAAQAAIRELVQANDDRCFNIVDFSGQRMLLEERLLRGQIAQGRYVALYSAGPPPAIAGAGPGEIAVEVYNQRLSMTQDVPSEVIRIFGDCVVAARPLAVDALIRTDVTTDEETAAISALSENFGPCLWEGQSIAFSRESLRAALADALYRKSEGRAVTELAARGENR